MEQSHLINWHSADQNILCHLWFPMLNTTTSLRSRQWLTGSCLIYINPVHTLRSHLSKIHFNITFPSIPESPSGIFPLGILRYCVCISRLFCVTSARRILLGLAIVIFGKEYKFGYLWLCNVSYPPRQDFPRICYLRWPFESRIRITLHKADVLLHYLATDWTTRWSRFDPRQRQEIFPLASVSRPALGPTQPPVQWVSGCSFLG
jgi:hypothetical protein